MKGRLKQRFLAIALCIAMIVTSVNLTNLFENNFNAIVSDETYFNYTGSVQTYIIPETGYYILECYGGEGGEDTHYFWHQDETNVYAPTSGGKGGYTKSKCYFEKGTVLYIYVGQKGSNGSESIYVGSASYNGGAAANGNCTGSGGGATDIRIGGTSLNNRIQVAGGGGGASWNIEGLAGGAATSGNNGTLGNGTHPSSYGGGGGGGYYGGTPGANNTTAAKGGSNYFDSSYGTLMENQSGINEGNGYVKIIHCQDYSLIIDPNGGIYDGTSNQIYYEKDTSSIASNEFNYTGTVQTYSVPADGVYKLEVYGARGGNDGSALGGYGGYTAAYATLKKGDNLYIYVGGKGTDNGHEGGWNGGGASRTAGDGNNGSGGGGTDIRLNGTGNGYDTSIDNRIIVAGGGGGAAGGNPWVNGRAGGGSESTSIKFQGSPSNTSTYNGGGGGGGYYGGRAGIENQSNNHIDAGGYGGTNYFDTSYGILITSQSGQRNGDGYAKISYIPSSELIKTPTREGYTFSGWSISGNGTLSNNIFTYGTGITTLTANWTKNITASTLTIDPNGGIYADSKENTIISADSGTNKTIENPTREGYTFFGWTKTGGGSLNGTTFTFNTTDAALTANWIKNTYSLTINPNGGIYNGSTSSTTKNEISYGTGTEINTPTRKGYTFVDWQISGSGSYMSDGKIYLNSNTTITAQWKINSYMLTVEPNGGTWNGNKSNSTYAMDYNSTKEISIPVAPEGYVFTGWTLSGTEANMTSLTSDATLTMGISDVVLTANYVEDELNVTYIDVIDSVDGKELNRTTVIKHYGDNVNGGDIGNDKNDNTYYNGYYLYNTTSATVDTSGTTVYRIFKLRTIDINGSVNWNDKSNAYSSRPNNVTIYLYRNGQQVDTFSGLTSSDNNSFSFKNLQKYDTSTGETYTYTVSQSDVESNNNPEDQYTTTVDTAGFNFTNTLGNTKQDNPNPEWVGFEVSGSILWDDYDDKFGTRPSEITLTLYQNDVAIKTQVIDKTATGYSFVNLDKYDDDLNPYTYKVKETFTAKVLTWDSTTKQYEEIDAYTITVDGFDFTNTLVDTKDKPIIEVKPDHINTLTIKLGFDSSIDWSDIEKTSSDVHAFVTLKQMETLMDNGTVSYTSNYNGMEYNTIVTETGVSINNIPSGKYECKIYS